SFSGIVLANSVRNFLVKSQLHSMKMNKSMLLASVAAVAILSSCRKEVSNVKKPSAADQGIMKSHNDLPETSAANFKAIESPVGGNVAGYYVGLPSRYDSTSKNYPLLIFIHGIGELTTAGKTLSAVSNLGTTRFLNQHTFPASFS